MSKLYVSNIKTDAGFAVCDENGKTVAVAQDKAFAVKVAAVEDLLAILESIIGASNTNNNGAYMGEAKVCRAYTAQAEAAIAKAKGA